MKQLDQRASARVLVVLVRTGPASLKRRRVAMSATHSTRSSASPRCRSSQVGEDRGGRLVGWQEGLQSQLGDQRLKLVVGLRIVTWRSASMTCQAH
jgi:hypothetical protein